MENNIPERQIVRSGLVRDWEAKHAAVLEFAHYDGGWMKTGLLPEYNALVAAERVARSRIDAFDGVSPRLS